ncbi:AAA family ATPase [Myxococcota bacterium]|nr:AAA family ATPase [Myxococcota bacterium]MBU1431545.1 AAA family ATPase [Myxococcota bacterium]MBU1896590.1 AAA family ATPase [Myxococcota bacterium]
METRAALEALRGAVSGALRGKDEVIFKALIAILARGHVLLEDAPGVGKTTLARALAEGLGGRFQRVQFTSDLLPSDLIGINIYDQQEGRFRFLPGPLFAHVVLADEINRASPRTQSALLEAMSEGQISVDNETHPLPRPFTLIATQNPQEMHGTYPLPEGQLDRFLMCLSLGYPPPDVERALLRAPSTPRAPTAAALSPALLAALQAEVEAIHVSEPVAEYVMRIIEETRRPAPRLQGVSTRGALALISAARARAFLLERAYVVPDDVKQLADVVLGHRVQRGQRHAEGAAYIRELLTRIAVPR